LLFRTEGEATQNGFTAALLPPVNKENLAL